MEAVIATMTTTPAARKQPTAETTFCADPELVPALRSTLTPLKPSQQTPASLPMGACYPKCMDVGDDAQLLPGVQAKRSSLHEADLVAKMQTFDLEELGLAHAPLKKQDERIVVDYEDSDGEHPQPRDETVTCALSACGPLTGGLDTGERVTRRRSRCGSSELRGKSVLLEPVTPSTSDEDEEPRCSKVHKLCMCEIKLHRSLESCWLVSSGQVYDVTGLVTAHPGGVRSILRKAGGPDCARDMKFHTKKARKMMDKCFIGKLQQCGDDVCADDSNCSIM